MEGNTKTEMQKVCVACDQPQGEPHLDWCPVVTGTLASIPSDSQRITKD